MHVPGCKRYLLFIIMKLHNQLNINSPHHRKKKTWILFLLRPVFHLKSKWDKKENSKQTTKVKYFNSRIFLHYLLLKGSGVMPLRNLFNTRNNIHKYYRESNRRYVIRDFAILSECMFSKSSAIIHANHWLCLKLLAVPEATCNVQLCDLTIIRYCMWVKK